MMDTQTANDAVEAFTTELAEFCELVRQYEDSWDSDDVPSFTYDVGSDVGQIKIPYKKNASTGEKCRNTKLYRTRQNNKNVYYTLRREYRNALDFLANSDRELAEFVGAN